MIQDMDHVLVPETLGKRIDDVSLVALCRWLFVDAIKKPPTLQREGGKYKAVAVALFLVIGIL